MQVHQVTRTQQKMGVIFEVAGGRARVVRYGAPYGEYIIQEVLEEDADFCKYVDITANIPIREVVEIMAQKICPNEKRVYFCKMVDDEY